MAKPKSERIRRSSPHRFDDRKKASSKETKNQQKKKPQAEEEGAEPTEASENVSNIPAPLQQRCLNIFRDALQLGQNSDDVALLQEVKGHLFNRDFATAFGRDDYLRVYASRWSPSRALGYIEIFAGLENLLKAGEDVAPPLNVVCLGGGAGAELVALAGWLSLQEIPTEAGPLQTTFVDVADWSSVVDALARSVTQPPAISQYASATAKEANAAMLDERAMGTTFQKLDLLDLDDARMKALVGQADVTTLMFTLNELYTASLAKTQRMLRQLTAAMRPGSLLLVVDSPGSYSTVSINGAEKRYPMQWLLDHSLLGPPKKPDSVEEKEAPVWKKLVSDASRWFRLSNGLVYPIELENMRYQIHLYERLGQAQEDG